MNKTTAIPPERLFAQHAQAKASIVSWHGNRVRVVELCEEHCFVKVVGGQGGNTGTKHKARYIELKEWCEPMVAPSAAEHNDVKEIHPLGNRELADAVEEQNATTSKVVEKETPIPTSVTVRDAQSFQEISVPANFHFLHKDRITTVQGWYILDADTKKVFQGMNKGWSQPNKWDYGLPYVGDKRMDNTMRKLIDERGHKNLRKITGLQLFLGTHLVGYWQEIAFGMKAVAFLDTPAQRAVKQSLAPAHSSSGGLGIVPVTDAQIDEAMKRVESLKRVKAKQEEIRKLEEALETARKELRELSVVE